MQGLSNFLVIILVDLVICETLVEIPKVLQGRVIPKSFIEPCKNCANFDDKILAEPKDPCSINGETTVSTVILIRSAIFHGDRRGAIRETWGSSRLHPWLRVVFLLATSGDSVMDKAVRREADTRADVLLGSFEEGYEAIPRKNMLAWRWVSDRCGHINHVMLSSDETFIDVKKLHLYTQQLDRTPRTWPPHRLVSLCYLFPCCTKVWHDHQKYRPRGARYDSHAYPAYCSGTAYMTSAKLMGLLYNAALQTPSFMPDDAWTGILLLKIGAWISDSHEAYTGISKRDKPLTTLQDVKYATSVSMLAVTDVHHKDQEADTMRNMWHVINSPASSRLSPKHLEFKFDVLSPSHDLILGRERQPINHTALKIKRIEQSVSADNTGIKYELLAVMIVSLFISVKIFSTFRRRKRTKCT